MSSGESSSPWLYVGLGCLAAVVLVVGSCVAIGFFGVRKAKQLQDEITDPAKRQAKVLDVLGAEELPPGYYPMMAMSMPLGMMEMAMLTDEPPHEDDEGRSVPGQPGASGLIWVSQRDFGGKRAELAAYLRGEGKRRGALEGLQTNVDFDTRKLLARGEIVSGTVSVLYASYEGSVGASGHRDVDAVTTLFEPLCPDESRVHTGIWWVPARPESGEPDEEGAADRAAESSDARPEAVEPEASEAANDDEPSESAPAPPSPEELTAFLSYFDLCG